MPQNWIHVVFFAMVACMDERRIGCRYRGDGRRLKDFISSLFIANNAGVPPV